MSSPERTRNRIYTNYDPTARTRIGQYYYDLFTNSYYRVDFGTAPVKREGRYDVCIDYNNRYDKDFHKSTDIRKGYISGQPFLLKKESWFSDLAYLPTEVCSLGQDGKASRVIDGYVSMESGASSELHQVFTEMGKPGAPYDPLGQADIPIYSYLLRARRDLRPDLPIFDSFRELGELRDIPDLIGQTKDALFNLVQNHGKSSLTARGVARANLAVSFGYLPILSTIRSFTQAYFTFTNRLRQLIRDDGRQVRRRKNYTTHAKTKKTWTFNFEGVVPYLDGELVATDPSTCSTTFKVTASNHCWAVGTYVYNLPKGKKDLPYMKKLAAKLFNFRITPGQLYDLVPWTWLLDWFTNAGRIVHAFDPGVGENGAFTDFFFMVEKLTTVDITQTFVLTDYASGDPVPVELHSRRTYAYKRRIPLGPFDSNFWSEYPGDFSDFQWSILVNLGVAKFPRIFLNR